MTGGKITIIWKSFKEVYPSVLNESNYNHFKSYNIEIITPVKHKFWSEFLGELIFISLGILSLIADSYHWYLRGGLIEILLAGFLIIGIGVTLSFIPSAISFTASYINTKILFSRLNNNVKKSKSYKDFCQIMCESDKRYIMELKRLDSLQTKATKK